MDPEGGEDVADGCDGVVARFLGPRRERQELPDAVGVAVSPGSVVDEAEVKQPPQRRIDVDERHAEALVLPDAVIASAVLDRLVHHAHLIPIVGDSYRMKDLKTRRRPAREEPKSA